MDFYICGCNRMIIVVGCLLFLLRFYFVIFVQIQVGVIGIPLNLWNVNLCNESLFFKF